MLRNLKSFNLPELEEKVLAFWKEKHIFAKSLDFKRPGSNGKRFSFWEGPPTANGRPGLHHVLARSFKDVVLRFKTMQGYTVPRIAGWDTHGLPVELQVEKQLGLASKKDIERYGVAAFNEKCKESVWQYTSEWEKLTERMGYWLDLDHPYVTYENSYVEALWGIIAKIHARKLLYEGHKIVPWCPRCGTALSSHELAQGYKTVSDQSVFVIFNVSGSKLKVKGPVGILSWTTTPWTLPGNVALAVGEKISYGLFKHTMSGQQLIVAESRKEVLGDGFEKVKTFKGSDLVGLSYEPLFHVPALASDASYRVYPAKFVTDQEGTGVVHTAVMYGEDDYELGKKIGLVQHHTVDESGRFSADVKGFGGLLVKSEETEKKIFSYLDKGGNLFKQVAYEHEYPFCWRCGTPLLYYARSSWFVAMSKLKKELLAGNERINWVPEHIKHGRFGEWLRDVKDWNFSRERYWGTPLPVWRCDACAHIEVLGSFDQISKRADRKNTYFAMRHGQATSNVEGWLAGGKEPKSGQYLSKLTDVGVEQVQKTARLLAKEKIDIIYASPYHRTAQTAKIVAKALGVKIVFDKRLGETDFGVFNHKKITDYWTLFKEKLDTVRIAPEGGESLQDVRKRVLAFFKEIDMKHSGQKILIVTHGDPSRMLRAALDHSDDEAVARQKDSVYLHYAEYRKLSHDNLPVNPLGYVDPHRPYVDAVTFACKKCKAGKMKRIAEVADVWFDSGSMPFASDVAYPADYICEAIDQTRGWFYTLLAVAALMQAKLPPYKNVISVGLIHDKQGQKMSKSKGNVVDPWALMQKYGADAVRWYFFTLNDPGDVKNFDEQDVVKALRRFHMTAYNSYAFLSMYGKRGVSLAQAPVSSHILDAWILERLGEVERLVVERMEAYDPMRAAIALEEFINDLSRWYIRRSRRRLQKHSDTKDWEAASATLGYALLGYAKLLAPFSPFFAEGLFQSLKKDYKGILDESVHVSILRGFAGGRPRASDQLSGLMQWARDMASGVLAKRAELGIKVRQPLSKLIVKEMPKSKYLKEVLAIVKDEINVKDIIKDGSLGSDFELDREITPELKSEGILRELVRTVQGLRQEAGYQPKESIALWIAGSEHLAALIGNNEKELMQEVGARRITMGRYEKVDAQIETKVDEYKSWIGIAKAK